MDLSHLQSGLASVWADVKQFLAAVRFARPGLLWLSLAPILLAVVGLFAARAKRRQVAEFGRPAAVAGLLTRRSTAGRLARFLRMGSGRGEQQGEGEEPHIPTDSLPAAARRHERANSGRATASGG